MCDLSFLQLVNQLSEYHATGRARSGISGKQDDNTTWQQFLVQESSGTASRKLKRCKQICFDGLFKAKSHPTDNCPDGSGKDELQSEAFRLALQNQKDKSGDLLECIENLPDNDSDTQAVIHFLLALKDTTSGEKRDLKHGFQEMGDCIDTFKRIRLNSSTHEVYDGNQSFESGVRSYQTNFNFKAFSSDHQDEATSSRPYRLYSKKDFQLSSSCELGGGKFLSDPSCSSAVPPVFSPDKNAFKQCENVEQRDEGYSSPLPNILQSTQENNGDIWDTVLAEQSTAPLTWDNFGSRQPTNKQKPFVSEAEGLTVHNLWKKCMMSLNMVYPEMCIPELCMIPEPTLCTHICYLLTGIQSHSFTYNKDDKKFEILPGLCIEGLSPDSLASLCQKYLEVGAIYRHIYNFLNAQREKPCSRTVVGFCAGIHRYIDLHSSSCIYIASRVGTLGKLVESVRPLVQQLQMIGSMCKVTQDPQGWTQLPTGIELLSLLLKVSVHVCQEKETLILISLFKSAVEPYFRFLKRWLFSGECERSYKEFGLKMDMRYVSLRTVDYWNLTHCLAQINDSGEATAFLADIQEKVFRTGKSLALLKIIAPNHHLCGRFREIQPNFMLAVTNEEQNTVKNNVEKYSLSVEETTQAQALGWQQRKEQQRLDHIQHAKLVQQRNNEDLERLRKEREDKEMERKLKQKQRHQELLKQMEQSKANKEEEKRKRRREEELIQEEADRIAEEGRRREAEELEKIREFYERLEREAEDRERRADWRHRRNNPAFKCRRMLLHRELHEEEINKLSKIKYPQSDNQQTTAEEGPVTRDLAKVTGITGISLEPDSEGNYIVVCMDSQGNRVEVGLDSLQQSEDTANLLTLIKTHPFAQLPQNVRSLIFDAMELKQSDLKNSNTKTNSPFPPRRDILSPHILNQRKSSIADFLYQDGYTVDYSDRNGNPLLGGDDVDTPSSPSSAKTRKNSKPIERILYPQRYFSSQKEEVKCKETEINLKITGKPLPYTKAFPQLKQPSKQITDDTPLPILEATTFPPLSLILQNSILVPLRAQQKLVDAALLSQLLVDYKLEDHLIALRRYLFLADGEFGQQLVISMCMLGKDLNPADKLAGQLHLHLGGNAPVPALLCPGSLNRVLEAAIAASQEGAHDPLAWNLTFALKEKSDYNLCIPGLSLGYRVSWPCNILLSQDVLSKYSSVLEFMVNIRTCLVSLELDWGHQNLGNRKQRKMKSTNFQQHRLNIMRHEMLNFVRNLHSYVTAQVLEVSWMEFQENLHNKVTNLDELIVWHNKYLNRVLFRCLLNQKAAPVMRFIKMIFQAINRFTSLICLWKEPGDEKLWEEILKQYAAFERTSKFFFNLVTKLMVRGYDTHFQDLLTRLNFNGYYTTNLDNTSFMSITSLGSSSVTST